MNSHPQRIDCARKLSLIGSPQIPGSIRTNSNPLFADLQRAHAAVDRLEETNLIRTAKRIYQEKYADPDSHTQIRVIRTITDREAAHLSCALLDESGHLRAIYRDLAWKMARDEAAQELGVAPFTF